MMRVLIVALAIAFGFSACQKENKGKSAVYGSFFIRYMEDGNWLQSNVSFYEGDTIATAKPKTWKGGVSLLGSAMDARNLPGDEIRYITDRQIDFITDYTFRFSEDNANLREVKTNIQPISPLKFKAPASKSAGLILEHGGTPMESGESIVVLLTDSTGQTYTIELSGPQRSSSLVLNSGQVENIPAGTYEWYGVRKKQRQYKEEYLDYSVETEYYAKAVKVEILH
jgi:hypothetical protein